jgi:hypothetical protein
MPCGRCRPSGGHPRQRCFPTTLPHAWICRCSFGCDEALSFVFLPMGADFAEPAIALATALLPAEAEAALWRTQVGAGSVWLLSCQRKPAL